MTIKEFTLDVLKEYKLFYILDFVDTNKELTLQKLTPDGYIDVVYNNEMISPNKHEFFQMNNGHVLLAFIDPIKTQRNYNYIVSDGEISEIVCTQAFERIYDYYGKPVESSQGFFIFMDSIPMNLEGLDWRCDNSAYGPIGYNVGKDLDKPVLKTLSQIRVYEPILSINGVGHLIYADMDLPEEITEYFINGNPIPFYARTLSETFKQVSEWAEVAKDPFNNTEDMAIDSKEFLNQYRFDNSLISNQADMQIFEYLKGNADARKRPEGVQPIDNSLKEFVKSRVCFSTLSALLTVYPDAWDIDEVISAENNEFQNELNNSVLPYVDSDVEIAISNRDAIIASAMKRLQGESLSQSIDLKLKFLQTKRNFLDLLIANSNHIF